jgi:hypothetical protein
LSYADFISAKSQAGADSGFEPVWLPDCLFDFQAAMVTWGLRKGRADCGMGKGLQELVWAENIVRQTNGNVLVKAPLAVAAQLVREAEKFGIEAHYSRDGKVRRGIKRCELRTAPPVQPARLRWHRQRRVQHPEELQGRAARANHGVRSPHTLPPGRHRDGSAQRLHRGAGLRRPGAGGGRLTTALATRIAELLPRFSYRYGSEVQLPESIDT